MDDKYKVKAVVLVTGNEVFITTNKTACVAIPMCFNLASKAWKMVSGRRPWKSVDEILDKIFKEKK